MLVKEGENMKQLTRAFGVMCLIFILASLCTFAAPDVPPLPMSKLADIEKATDTGGIPVILMVTTDSCTTCEAMKVYFATMSIEFKDKVTFMIANADKSPDVKVAFGVRWAPTTIFFGSKGNIVKSTVGVAITEAQMRQTMKDLKFI